MVGGMPSGPHESVVEATELPDVQRWLLEQRGVKLPQYHLVRQGPTEARKLTPRTFRSDGVTIYCDAANRPVAATVREVQHDFEPNKLWMWKVYAAHLQEQEKGVVVLLLVYCPNPKVAERYRACFEDELRGDCSLILRPYFYTSADIPWVTSVEEAEANPALTLLSVVCHGQEAGIEKSFRGMAAALPLLGNEYRHRYHEMILAGLPEPQRKVWEAVMTTAVSRRYLSEVFNEIDSAARNEGLAEGEAKGRAEGEAKGRAEGEAKGRAEGEAKGRAEGEAKGRAEALVTILRVKGIDVPNATRQRIMSCTDPALLDTWIARATTMTTIHDLADLLGPDSPDPGRSGQSRDV
jgi:hypothetical protein